MGAFALLLLSAVPVLLPTWHVEGPPFPLVNWIATSSDGPELVYAATSDPESGQSALFRSSDGGASWTLLAEALSGDQVSSVETDPAARSRLYATTTHGTLNDLETRVYVSEDSGIHWQNPLDLTGSCGGSFAFEGANPEVVYVVLSCSGRIFATFDDGVSWIERASPSPVSFHLQAAPDGTLYAATYDGIFRSTDGANSWSLFAVPPDACPGITALLLDDQQNVLILGTGRPRFGGLECGGTYRSEDAGRTWTPTLGNRYMTDFVRDPGIPTRIFASARRVNGFFAPMGDVYRSDDDGRSWQSLTFPSVLGTTQVRLSSDGRRLYALGYVLPIRRPLTVGPR